MNAPSDKNVGREPLFLDSVGASVKRRESYPGRLPEFEFGRLRVPDEETHRLLLKAGQGGSY
ncbi:hypothetical protein [Thiohalomonas denitrificans]|uniref:Uncharacterized protein n=1 Tax=Thiohalomonas denitrificans TaxID=415747 RepID=A0A1G5PIN9_9GAMM|nr:hypothetical protein [Thiohalomonas denitrificans]SCZ49071.1 hypothetical protein SAMN03097708_00028 [Thiohalomonas denitrificans]